MMKRLRYISAVLLVACARLSDPAHAEDVTGRPHPLPERVETFSHGPVSVELSATPGSVDLSKNIQFTIRVTTPENIVVKLPALGNRLKGFVIAGNYRPPAVEENGTRIREAIYQLTPTVSDEYRIAPFAVAYEDTTHDPPRAAWFPTQPIVLERTPLIKGAPAPVSVDLEPIWIRPAFKTVAIWVLSSVGAVLLLALILYLLSRIRHDVQMRRLSPRERALRELGQLLRRNLIKREKYKSFYLELTMIVRRYIERAHQVRAPEQTTEEFLQTASQHAAFTPEVLNRLQAFLQAADLVKFAGVKGDRDAADTATRTANTYIEEDAAANEGPHTPTEGQQ